ncbi:MAG: hypothetical protein RL701_2048 [Pseudomonadota bacterium]
MKTVVEDTLARWTLPVPAFVDEVVAAAGALDDDASYQRLAIRLSHENVARGGGPFAAVVSMQGRLLCAGVNGVLSSGLSIAHAEIVAITLAQQALSGAAQTPAPLTLYSSTEPCCQCFGALLWSGVTRLVCAATTQDAEDIGFDEGPKPHAWPKELERRGISVELGVCREEARAVLQEYARRGGLIYGSAAPPVAR